MYKSILIRSALGLLLSFIATIAVIPKFIAMMRRVTAFQPRRFGTPDSHEKKTATPIMGGLVIIAVTFVTSLIFCNLSNPYILVLLSTMILFCLAGFYDDYKKVFSKPKSGLSARSKIMIQTLLSCVIIYWLETYHQSCEYCNSHLNLPWLYGTTIKLGFFYTAFKICTLVATSNAVNLTDGLDGLISVPVIINILFFAATGYSIYHAGIESEHVCFHAQDMAEIIVFSGVIIGAILGFLWFNSNPAKIFMGDSGSISLGAVLATIAVIMRNELTLILVGGVFVLEGISVVLQVGSFKLTGKRIFKIAPFHHHLEACGWSEMQIVVRFWIATILLSIIGFLIIKF